MSHKENLLKYGTKAQPMASVVKLWLLAAVLSDIKRHSNEKRFLSNPNGYLVNKTIAENISAFYFHATKNDHESDFKVFRYWNTFNF